MIKSKKHQKLDFSRQLLVAGMNEERQERINNSRVLVIGAGGLATTALSYLGVSGVSAITIVDFDSIEASNLHRQTLFTPDDIGRNKAEVARDYLTARAPCTNIKAISYLLGIDELLVLAEQHDVILDCTDDLAFSYMLNDVAILQKKPVVFANAIGMTGQIFTIVPTSEVYACFRCVWPENLKVLNSCDTAGVIGPVPGVMGSLQALEALKLISGFCSAQSSILYHVDFKSFNVQPISIPIDKDACDHHLSERATIQKYAPLPIFEGTLADAHVRNFKIIDVRNSDEVATNPCIFTTSNTNLNDLLDAPHNFIHPDDTYVLICETGKRSKLAVKQLKILGYDNLYAYEKSWIHKPIKQPC